MAFDAFLKIDGISGDSTDQTHKGEIDVMSFSWGESNASANRGPGGGGGAGRVSFQDLHIGKSTDSASPLLFQACASGKHIKSATLTLRKAGGEAGLPAVQDEFLKLSLTNVLVSSYQTGNGLQDDGSYSPRGGDEDLPAEQLTLNFQRIEFNYTAQSPTGVSSDQVFDLGG
jgi:type VI secretion system secreted protein Hcp